MAMEDLCPSLEVSDVDESLRKASQHSAELEQRARLLQAHFQQAQSGMHEISRLCDEADVSVRRSQSLLNRSAHRVHELNERTQHLLKETPHSSSLQAGGGSFSMASPSGTAGRSDSLSFHEENGRVDGAPRKSSKGPARRPVNR
ncbi:unnamed protein product [Polarella glacialis]|uniref:Uncharacterized protein n=1 Tax=Polarella glacialis TaxID=89957 RepID=A0A813HWE2_POLGL|nr:unnamed protein product [Polarella glacialis]CAE8643309.1 unnamed protein product [Polarella glacialis]CAE8735430.1 unnamed protein product [Polarella glacialis]